MGIILTASLGIGGIFGGGTPVQADEVSTINGEINKLEDELKQASNELKDLSETVTQTQSKIEKKNQEIRDTKTEIESLQLEIEEIQKRIEARNVVLKDRARSLQETGGTISYLEVILGAQSFSDFINRTEAVATIVSADKDILTEHNLDMERVSQAKAEIEDKLQSLETMLSDLKQLEEETNAKMKELEDKESKLQAEVKELMDEKEELLAASNVSQQIVQTSQSTSSSAPPATSVQGNGEFGWPAVGGIITSYQGPRWGKFHKGIDIAGVSNRAILAADGGTVAVAGWHNDYGNYVKINHPNGYTTLYAHMSSLNVSAGQSVSKGTQIGVMGSTGRSTGMHLHFEVLKNGKLINPMSVL